MECLTRQASCAPWGRFVVTGVVFSEWYAEMAAHFDLDFEEVWEMGK